MGTTSATLTKTSAPVPQAQFFLLRVQRLALRERPRLCINRLTSGRLGQARIRMLTAGMNAPLQCADKKVRVKQHFMEGRAALGNRGHCHVRLRHRLQTGGSGGSEGYWLGREAALGLRRAPQPRLCGLAELHGTESLGLCMSLLLGRTRAAADWGRAWVVFQPERFLQHEGRERVATLLEKTSYGLRSGGMTYHLLCLRPCELIERELGIREVTDRQPTRCAWCQPSAAPAAEFCPSCPPRWLRNPLHSPPSSRQGVGAARWSTPVPTGDRSVAA